MTTPRVAVVRRGRRVVRLGKLDQVWWRDVGLRKLDLVDYYRSVGPAVVPHLRRRPFTIKRYPNGPRGPCFWIKDAPPELPDWIPVAPLPAKSRRGETVAYPVVNDELALLWMVDFGCVDLHVWYSRIDRPDRPDYVLFDLDPAAGAGFAETVRAAHLLRDALDAIGLESVVKTSGEGLHVQVPVARAYTYAETRKFSEVVAGALVRTQPRLVTTERVVSRRGGVFVDTKMNGEGMTVVAPYSVRPRPGAPVATPLRWDELHERLDPSRFTPREVLARLERHGDLFAPVLRGRQRLERALRRLA